VWHESGFFAVENRRKELARYGQDITRCQRVSDFSAGQVEVRLTNADSGEVLYKGAFSIATKPLKAAFLPQAV